MYDCFQKMLTRSSRVQMQGLHLTNRLIATFLGLKLELQKLEKIFDSVF